MSARRLVAKRAVLRSLAHAVLIVAAVVFLGPFFWLVSTSLKPDAELSRYPPALFPSNVRWANYPDAFHYIPFLQYLGNSFYIAAANVVAIVLSCSLIAYGFARIQWPGRDALFVVVLATLMIPAEVVLIPQYVLFRQLNWVNTFNPLILPALTGSPVYVFLLRQYFLTLPYELTAAGKVDGANEFQIYWRIIMPLSRPALTAVAILTFVSQWNSFLGPLIYLNDSRLYTLAIGLTGFFSSHGGEWSLLMAAVIIMILPVLVLFFVFQRNFIEGIQLTGRNG